MFRLSRGAEYAIRSVLYLSGKPAGEIVFSEEISRNQDIPRAYLSKIFQSLARKGIIKSHRGAKGGVTLLKSPEGITVFDVIVAMEGDIFLNDCLIHKGYCPKDPVCPAHFFWRDMQNKFCDNLREANFQNLLNKGRELEKAGHGKSAFFEKYPAEQGM